MTVSETNVSSDRMRSTRRAGYFVSMLLNAAMIVVAWNILDWGWLPFLTEDLALVVPWISLSLAATIVANLIYWTNDSPVIKSAGQVMVNFMSAYATYTMLTVFPFDFAGHAFDWELVTRIVLVIAIVGAGIGALVEGLKLVSRLPARTIGPPRDSHA